jgi:hypothetical protein
MRRFAQFDPVSYVVHTVCWLAGTATPPNSVEIAESDDVLGKKWNPVSQLFEAFTAAKTKADLENEILGPDYQRWRMWADTLAEATRRGMSVLVLTALQNKVDAVWASYAQAINDWRSAA